MTFMQTGRSAPTVAVLAALALALTACGGGNGDDAETGADRAKTESWSPTRDVVFTVPYEAGGGTDQLARALAAGIKEVDPDVTIVVETRPGASGAVGYTEFSQQEGNPHRLVAAETNMVTVPMLTDVAFEWKEFTPVAQVTSLVGLAMARSGTYKDLPDLVAKAKQEKVTVGLAGLSGPLAIAATLTEKEAGVEFERVVFNSGAEVLLAVLAGDVDFGIAAPELALENIKAGTITPLGVFADERLEGEGLSEIPTAAEQGIAVDFAGPRGVMAAPGIKPEEAKYWVDTLGEVVKTKAFTDYVTKSSAAVKVRLGDEFAKYLAEFEATAAPAVEEIKATQNK